MGNGSKKSELKMIIRILFCALLFIGISSYADEIVKFKIKTNSEQNRELVFALNIPENYSKADSEKYRIMVLFGGRNWDAEKTIKTYNFNRHSLFLLSPSFKDDDYWEPEKWSGKALLDAVERVRKDYGLSKDKKLLYYGYSAGGQCANLFANWKPEIVDAWGAHACGVWFKIDKISVRTCSFVTCGEDDIERYQLSMMFIHNVREKGYPVIWKSFPEQGHELSKDALSFAEKFFDSFLSSNDRTTKFIGDDQSMDYYPTNSKKASHVEVEDANPFWDEELARVWKTGK